MTSITFCKKFPFQINLPDLGIDADFCDMEPNGCATTDPGCDTIAPGDGIKEFCSCSSLKVPDYAPVSIKNIPITL